jgi:hypothetical protein
MIRTCQGESRKTGAAPVIEVKVDVPDGIPDNVVRSVTENYITLKFKSHGFEEH